MMHRLHRPRAAKGARSHQDPGEAWDRPQAAEGTSPTGALVWGFRPPELRDETSTVRSAPVRGPSLRWPQDTHVSGVTSVAEEDGPAESGLSGPPAP